MLSQYCQRFTENLAKISADRVAQRDKVHVLYQDSLESLRDAAQQAGHLELVLQLLAEKERFRKEPVMPKMSAELPPDIRKLSIRCQGLLESADLSEACQTVTLAGQFEGALGQLMQTLTRQGKMTEALAVRQELAALKSNERVVEARDVVAKAAVQTPKQPRIQPTVETPSPLAPRPKLSGLIAHWSFNEGDARDGMGSFNGALVGNPGPHPADQGIDGGSMAFSRQSESRIVVADSQRTLAGLKQTVTLWVFLEDTSSDIHYGLVEKLPHDRIWCFFLEGDDVGGPKRLFLRGGAVNPPLTGKTPIVAKRWYFCAAVWDGHTARLYLDGKLDASGTITPVRPAGGSDLLLGCTFRIGAYYDFLQGFLDEVQYFDRALSADEIRSIFLAGEAATRRSMGMAATTNDR